MNENTDIENIFKAQMGQSDVPFSEGLWNKLDVELVPIREAYRKERKRRAIAYWVTAAVVLVGGGSSLFYYANNNQDKRADKVIINTNPKQSCCSKPTVADRFKIEQNPFTLEDNTKQQEDVASLNNGEESNNNSNSVIADVNNIASISNSSNKGQEKIASNKVLTKSKTSNRKPKVIDNTITEVENSAVATTDKNIKVSGVKEVENTTPEIIEQSSNLQPTDAVVAVDNKDAQSNTKKNFNVDLSKKSIITDAKKVNSTVKPTAKVQAVGGVNFTSSFNKPSYYGGAQLQLAVNQKLIFAGVKLSMNDLNHQLLNVDKAGTSPTSPDAIIQKMTTIQVPFGYQFLLNKKQPNSTLLSVGFEPTFLTGIQTVYFDNNGVPGGPTTAVANSPLINKAINKFNVSFIAGVQRRISRRTHLFANVGYGLINITDKQFYNKVGTSNNLKYAQLGLGFDLIK